MGETDEKRRTKALIFFAYILAAALFIARALQILSSTEHMAFRSNNNPNGTRDKKKADETYFRENIGLIFFGVQSFESNIH